MSVFFEGSSGHVLADRRYDFALQLAERGDLEAAADLLRQGLDMAPRWPPLHFHLGEVLRRVHDVAGAAKAFGHYLKLDPADKMGARVKLVLMGVEAAPPTLPPSYVQSLFDQYASRFDKTLLETLAYKTPQMLAAMVPGNFDRLLDLGCGTGLATAEFSGRYRYAEGVDLSPAMIEQARAKNLYGALHAGSLEEYLNGAPEPFDLVLCADVFVYIGDLAEIFSRTARLMTPGGVFAFSVQSLAAGDYALGADHRYAHTRKYIARCAKGCGLSIDAALPAALRKDGGRDVNGMLFKTTKNHP